MPNWKKIITSGSDATLNSLNLTNGVTGSFTGSFAGDGSQLTGISTNFQWTFDFTEEQKETVYAPYNLVINSIDTELGTAVITIEVNGVAYTLGNPIDKWDEIKVTSDVPVVLILNVTKL